MGGWRQTKRGTVASDAQLKQQQQQQQYARMCRVLKSDKEVCQVFNR